MPRKRSDYKSLLALYHTFPKASELLKVGWIMVQDPTELPKSPGVYAIYDQPNGDCLYVGKSKNIRYRVCPTGHSLWLQAKDYSDSSVIYYRLVDLEFNSSIRLRWAESLAIGLLKPSWNFGGIEWLSPSFGPTNSIDPTIKYNKLAANRFDAIKWD